MKSKFFIFPNKAEVGRVLPKNKVFTYSRTNSRIQEVFAREVRNIVWAYKLSPKTINIPAGRSLAEIEVFDINLKGETLSEDVLKTIDKSIPSPILFRVNGLRGQQYVMCYKRQSEADTSKRVISSYYYSEFVEDDIEKEALPFATDLFSLQLSFIENVAPYDRRSEENINDYIERLEQIGRLEREAKKLENKMLKEKQFNRKVDMNKEIRVLRESLLELKV